MIIGPNWFFVHIPKSGGTFIRRVLVEIIVRQEIGGFYWLLPRIRVFPFLLKCVTNYLLARGGVTCLKNQHTLYSEMSPEHKSKTAIVAYRNPLDILVSSFYYDVPAIRGLSAKWKAEVLSCLPNFPNHSFEDWVKFDKHVRVDRRLMTFGMLRDDLGMDIGSLSYAFISLLFKDPEKTLRTMDRDYFISGRYKKDMCSFVKVRTENLNEDLYHVLVDFGIHPTHMRFLKTEEKVNVTKGRQGKDWREFYDNDLLDYVLKKEWVWFQVFPEHLEQLKESFPGYFARNTAKIGAGN